MEDFEKIYSEYYDVVFGYVLTLCRSEDLAEEVTQETFFRALKKIDSFRGECRLSVWLCQIAKNMLYTISKRQGRQTELVPENVPPEDDIERQLIRKDDAFRLHGLLHAMGEPYKEVFWMRTFGELSFGEIGAIFGKTESWARVTYHRARLKLKEGIK